MRRKLTINVLTILVFCSLNIASHAEELFMQKDVVSHPKKDAFYVISNPLKIEVNSELTIKEGWVKGMMVIENPSDSNEDAVFNKNYDAFAWQVTYEGKLIEGVPPERSEIKPQPLTDNDFLKLKPGERFTEGFEVDLNSLQMLEGTHQYQLFFAARHVLPSVASKIFKLHGKFATNIGTKSNTVTFTYTKASKDGKDISNPPSPPFASPDKLNDASNPDNLVPPRLPLGTQVSSLRSCPESGIYECPADAPGVTEHRLFIHKGRPMPSAFITQTKPGIAGVFGGQELQQVETTWTLIAYE